MIQLYRGYKKPIFTAEVGGFFVTLYNRNSNNALTEENRSTELNEEKEQKILEYVDEHIGITRKEAEQLLKLKQTGAYSILKDMCDKGLLTQMTEGKFTKYYKR